MKITERQVWEEWSSARLTVLDELGIREAVTSASYEVMAKAIDSRENKPAVYISNLPLDGIKQVYDRRISSRLAAGTVITMSGDRRVTGQ